VCVPKTQLNDYDNQQQQETTKEAKREQWLGILAILLGSQSVLGGRENKIRLLPLGITPGSMNVANVKLAITKNAITPSMAGTHGCWKM
jgi:hypothetical protein